MTRPNYIEQIEKRIYEIEPGTVFAASDFADITDTKTVHMSLTRLTGEKLIEKVIRGIYYKPRYSKLLGEKLDARPDDVARTLARNYGWTIVPSDATALNVLGLSTQVPTRWQYISDGPYKEYDIGKSKIIFKHTNKNTELTKVSYKTALVIRALKAIGKDDMTEAVLSEISNRLTKQEKECLLAEAKYSTSWVYELIKRIC